MGNQFERSGQSQRSWTRQPSFGGVATDAGQLPIKELIMMHSASTVSQRKVGCTSTENSVRKFGTDTSTDGGWKQGQPHGSRAGSLLLPPGSCMTPQMRAGSNTMGSSTSSGASSSGGTLRES